MSTEKIKRDGTARRAERAAANRDRLIAAARAAFASQGYAAASMDELTAAAGLTRGALYHGFGDKKGLLAAVIAQLDGEMSARLAAARAAAPDAWSGLMAESVAYIRMALDPEVQRIMLLDGPAVLGNPSTWPGEQACLAVTIATLSQLHADGVIKPVDIEAAARLLNGAALTAALWVAAAEEPAAVLDRATLAFRTMAEGLLAPR
ncbi:transcriptional regulator, TetR family [Sphingomonas guangdongensis]|uniref:Transcriptional regulator, TetR family n=1 Tax=Sphingomonas guangdongensis TaxID=1141890 RepID=A0A285QDZ3_9SPHN|nr:TetR/AcrR family transcriptional regulator [Sphingomonas guangdongensis]SOB80066.1 transcriptional regulator, TetR family [Sphingomonas guangdongensis]